MLFTNLINKNNNILKGFINYENPNELIEKGKKGTIGEVRTHKDGKKYKKQANGKWKEISESHGLTKNEHVSEFKRLSTINYSDEQNEKTIINDMKFHNNNISKLDDKEYDDSHFEEQNSDIKEGLQMKVNGIACTVDKVDNEYAYVISIQSERMKNGVSDRYRFKIPLSKIETRKLSIGSTAGSIKNDSKITPLKHGENFD